MTTDEHLMEDHSDYILITPENLSKYGFVCFHTDGEPIIKDNFWVREIEINVGEEKRIQKFKILKERFIVLPQTSKITDTNNYCISSIPSPIKAIKLLLERAGWNQTIDDLDVMIDHGKEDVLLATYQEKIPLGSGVSLPVSDDLCWIGMILVHPELRRQGIARSIMNRCIEHARLVQNSSIIGLDATPLGKQVYDSLGFKDSFLIWRSIISTSWKNIPSSMDSISLFEIDLAKKYLRERNYIERIKIIELLSTLPGSKNMMMVSNYKILGFVMSRPGRLKPFVGPLVADSKETAMKLLSAVLNYWKDAEFESVFMDIPEHHLEESVFLNLNTNSEPNNRQITINPVRSFVRMYQLISDAESTEISSKIDHTPDARLALQKALDSHDATMDFIHKEKQRIVPIMYGTAGPEWS